MPIPQVNDRIKEVPVVVLRAVFAGIGQILLTADKVRARAAEQVWTPDRTTAPGPASQTGMPSSAGPRNGTAHAEPAVTGHAPISDAAPSTGTLTTTPPAQTGPIATAKATPGAAAAKTRPAATAKATPGATAAKARPAAATAPPAPKTAKPSQAAKAAKSPADTKTTDAKSTKPAKTTDQKATKTAKAAAAKKAKPTDAKTTKTTPARNAAPATKAADAKATKATPAASAAPAAKAVPAPRAGKTAKAGDARAANATPATNAGPAAKTTAAPKAPGTKAKAVPAPRAATREPATEPATGALPMPGYDELTLASLRGRLRVLDAATIQDMLAYEQAHARREPVITMLERRLVKITSGTTAG